MTGIAHSSTKYVRTFDKYYYSSSMFEVEYARQSKIPYVSVQTNNMQ